MNYTGHHSFCQSMRACTNICDEPESPPSKSSNVVPPILNSPIEILAMIARFLTEKDLFSLLLTATAFPFWLLPMALPMRLHGERNRSFLHYIALNGSPSHMRHILEYEECLRLLDTPDEDGAAPLHLAIDDPLMCQALLDAGANPCISTKHGSTPLHLAARVSPYICEILLDAGAEVDARNSERETPIFYAVEGGCAEAVKVLRSEGANLQAVEKNNLTVGQKAIMYGREDVILALNQEKEVSGRFQELTAATAHEFMQTVHNMIRQGRNPFENGGSKALSVIACWRSGGKILEGLENPEETHQETSIDPELLINLGNSKKRRREEDSDNDRSSVFTKSLRLIEAEHYVRLS